MIALSENARRSLDDYLRQARAYLRGSKSVDAGEIEQNITEHIENELEGASEPVSCDELEAVLEKLGDPQQWVPVDELPWWRRIILRVRSGPEDWRLAYISFGLFVAALAIVPTTPVFLVLILASFLASRAAISEAADTKELRAQKWLLYPSLIGVYGFLLLALLTWPLVLMPLGEIYEDRLTRFPGDLRYWVTVISANVAVLGAWWCVLAAVLLKPRKVARVLFGPFAHAFKPKWAFWLLAIGSGVMALSAGVCIMYYRYSA
jgi:hypothetical protein